MLVEQTSEAFAQALVPLLLDEGEQQCPVWFKFKFFPGKALTMGKAGHEHVAAKFSLKAFGESLEKTLLDIQHQGTSLGFYLVMVLTVILSLATASYQAEASS